jgi:hypothetical protein
VILGGSGSLAGNTAASAAWRQFSGERQQWKAGSSRILGIPSPLPQCRKWPERRGDCWIIATATLGYFRPGGTRVPASAAVRTLTSSKWTCSITLRSQLPCGLSM